MPKNIVLPVHNSDDFMLVFVIYNSKQNIFGFWTVSNKTRHLRYDLCGKLIKLENNQQIQQL